MGNLILKTEEVSIQRVIQKKLDQDHVDWAISLLEKGIDTTHVCILAGETKPFNQFEMADLIDRALKEVGAKTYIDFNDAILDYAKIRAHQLLDGDLEFETALHVRIPVKSATDSV